MHTVCEMPHTQMELLAPEGPRERAPGIIAARLPVSDFILYNWERACLQQKSNLA
jgi:hypothetical protein